MQTRILLIILALVTLPAAAGAAPLDKTACDTLRTERSALLAAGLEADRTRGPEWAKANLTPERLKLIEHLIEVEEQLSFRCDEMVTARPMLKEPPKPEKAVAAKKEGAADTSGDANTAASPDQAHQAKKKKASAAKAKPKSKESAAASASDTQP